IGRGFARSLESHGPCRRPGDGVPLRVGDGDHGIVETCVHVGDAGGDVLLFPAANACLVFGHALFPHLHELTPAEDHASAGSIETLTSSCRRSALPDLCPFPHWVGSLCPLPPT